MATTIKDIAKQLNISVSTVSYALNGGPRSVPDEVKAKVLATANSLGYRPNRNARSLITGKTNAIGVVPSQLVENIALGPFFQSSLNGIINEAERRRYDVLLFTRFDQSSGEPFENDLLDGRVDGLVFLAPPHESATLRNVARQSVPIVALNGAPIGSSYFNVANEEGVHQILSHLWQLGHRRIAHIYGKPMLYDSRVRETAYREFLAAHNIDVREDWVKFGDFTATGGRQAALELLSQKDLPTAIFCANDEMALGTLQAARERNIRVPEDLSICGFDDCTLGAYCYPTLTTVRQPIAEMAVAATQALIELIDHCVMPKSRIFTTELIIRASTASPREASS